MEIWDDKLDIFYNIHQKVFDDPTVHGIQGVLILPNTGRLWSDVTLQQYWELVQEFFHWPTVLGAPGITRDGMADHIYLVLQGDHDWHMQRTGKYEQNHHEFIS